MLDFPKPLHPLHVFKQNGELYAADLDKACLVEISPVIADILKLAETQTTEVIMGALKNAYMKYNPIFLFCSMLLALVFIDTRTVFAEAPITPKIVFTSWRDNTEEIYTMSPDGSDQVNLTQHFSLALNREPVWSPTGEQILFVSNRDGVLDLYLMDADGENVKRVFENARHRQNPTWHPNGKRIAYLDFAERAIYTASIDGWNPERIAPTKNDGGNPCWSPDGSEIAFVFGDGLDYQIRIVNVETGAHRTLQHPELQIGARDPAWSPEGDRIAYGSFPFLVDQDDQGTIYIVNRDGSDLWQVVPKAGSRVAHPTWSPRGDEILYQQKVDGDKQIFKFHLSSRVKTQLTHEGYNFRGNWFDPSGLPVHPLPRLLTTTWGKLKQK